MVNQELAGMTNGTDLSRIASRLYDRAMELDSLRFRDYTLSSGQKSSYYFDGQLLSTYPEGADLISRAFNIAMDFVGADAFGGSTVEAHPIVGALALRSHMDRKRRVGFFVRLERGEHGVGKQIEGNLIPGMKVAACDDTISTGESLFPAIDAVRGDRL